MKAFKTINRLAWISLILVYLVIIAGSVVRTTGSGMGCPDWPKCFGQWIPPTDLSQLPEGYEEHFLEGRKAKLDKYTNLIEAIGLKETAEAMRNDPTLLHSEPFDAQGTWIEYVNRLFGFLAGNAMLALMFASFWAWRSKKSLTIIAVIASIAIVFQAWLGSVVVATNLLPWTITIHMIVAFLIIALLLKVIALTSEKKGTFDIRLKGLLALAIFLTLVQVVLGTQVRQEIDFIADSMAPRDMWIASIGHIFEWHRSFPILLVLVNGYFLWVNRGNWKERSIQLLALLLGLEILAGITLAYLGMPAVVQTGHLLLATLFFAMQCRVAFRTRTGESST